MNETVLAYNIGHHASCAVIQDGVLKEFIAEEKLSKEKYDELPFMSISHIIDQYDIDKVLICHAVPLTYQEIPNLATTTDYIIKNFVESDVLIKFLLKKIGKTKQIELMYLSTQHHYCHALSGAYGSGFDEALVFVIDQGGSWKNYNGQVWGSETSGVFIFKDNKLTTLAKILHTFNRTLPESEFETTENILGNMQTFKVKFEHCFDVGATYDLISRYLRFGQYDSGKTMGLSSYGKDNNKIPYLIFNKEEDIIASLKFIEGNIDDHSVWHRNPDKISKVAQDIAYAIQKQSQEYVFDLIKKHVDKTGIKKIVLSGGYSLNCVANYYYLKRFRELGYEGIEIFADPIAYDGGTPVGAVKWYAYHDKKDISGAKLKNLYLGKDYKYNDYHLTMYTNYDVIDATAASVAKIIKDRNIVCMYQGGGEAGPRALGNRSILYDPTDINGRDFVNRVKRREWFRPFAGTVLKEHASEYFDMCGLKESPFMMFAVDVLPEKKDIIPAITHVDGTCRIQTVSPEQNKHFYELIQEFGNLTGVPILFNTSFNLGGETMVETLEDAVSTLDRSELKYLYLPELGKLMVKK